MTVKSGFCGDKIVCTHFQQKLLSGIDACSIACEKTSSSDKSNEKTEPKSPFE